VYCERQRVSAIVGLTNPGIKKTEAGHANNQVVGDRGRWQALEVRLRLAKR
jgi:hypothetical protein